MVVTSKSLGNSTNSSARLGGPDQPISLDFASPSVGLPTEVLRRNFIEGISPEHVMHIAAALLSATLIWREFQKERREREQHAASKNDGAFPSPSEHSNEGVMIRRSKLDLAA